MMPEASSFLCLIDDLNLEQIAITASSAQAGPMVQTIFVFLIEGLSFQFIVQYSITRI